MKKIDTTLTQITLLGGISPEDFLKHYWQKKPLLIRAAIPTFKGLLSANELAGLACEEDVQSRLISFSKGKWKLENGAFDEKRFAKLPEKDWTLLVQGVNHHLPEAAELLKLFNFIPHARLDDLMVSYAPDGGGVGPHFDSYDVFLLQGQGQRLWRISEQKDLSLIEGAPLRILQNFQTEQEFVLEAGDMLYLPPQVAHWGIAVGECMTYSIGFRAPSAQELATQFLAHMQERIALKGMYSDPALSLQKHPAKISAAMIDNVSDILSKITWKKADIAQFLGQYLSEPKDHVLFESPANMTLTAFTKAMHKKGLSLSLKTLALFDDDYLYINGETLALPQHNKAELKHLADMHQLSAEQCAELDASSEVAALLHQWYLCGYIHLGLIG